MGGGVYLGMPGAWAKDYYEVADHYTTKIGGVPDWPVPVADLRGDLLKCGVCGSYMCLIAQVYAPLSSYTLGIEERIVYVLGCVMSECGIKLASWRALRLQKCYSEDKQPLSVTEEITLPVTPLKLEPTKICREDNVSYEDDVVSNEDIDMDELSRLLSEAASLASYSKKKNSHHKVDSAVRRHSQPRPVISLTTTKLPVVPCFYIYPQEEKSLVSISGISSNHSSLSIKENQGDFSDPEEKEAWEGEGYEYDKSLFVDRTYLKFKKRLDMYPEQCFRYAYAGIPLLATNELDKPRSCECCGAIRHFEMQLMPPLLFFLREAGGASPLHSLEDWGWMTIIIFTCSMSCSLPSADDKSGYNGWTVTEENVIVQFE